MCTCMLIIYRTVLKQTATIDVFGVALVGSLLESLLIKSYASTVAKVSQHNCTECACHFMYSVCYACVCIISVSGCLFLEFLSDYY